MMGTYMSFDLCVNVFLIKIQTPMDRILVVHHLVGMTGSLLCLIGGYGMLNLGMFVSMTEFSTIPLNRRNMMTKRENTTKLGKCNNIFFALSFTVFRVINMPWCCYKVVVTFGSIWDKLGGFKKFCLIFGAIEVLFLTLLNYYWYYKIIMMLKRSLGYAKPLN